MNTKKYLIKCYNEYNEFIGLPKDYNFYFGNPVEPVVPAIPINNQKIGIMIIGAYPTAKFGTINGITDVPLYNINFPFSDETYFDGSRKRSINSRQELVENYLNLLGISVDNCWLTNLVKVFLFKQGHVNRYQKLGRVIQETRSKYKEYADKSHYWLAQEIKLAKPQVVFMLGAEVTSSLFKISINKSKTLMDGNIRTLSFEGIQIQALCLPHPGIIMHKSSRNPWPRLLREDIIPRAKKELIGFIYEK